MSKPILIVGAGFAGATLAQQLAQTGQYNITVLDASHHVAGNCHTERDDDTGVMVHCYGPHIFHTDRLDIWQYVNTFGEFVPFVNRVKANIDRGIFSLPINLATINQFFSKQFSPNQAQAFVRQLGDDSIEVPQNFEQQALKFIGPDLYQAFFYGYTKKQWGCEPQQLPASLLKRLPVRFNYDDNYYADPWQGIPRYGYTNIVQRMLTHERITVQLHTRFMAQDNLNENKYAHVFYSGTLDGYFDYRLGRLGYRTVYWQEDRQANDIQGTAVINYPDLSVPYTRIHEHKHFAPWEEHENSVAFIEYSKETAADDIPYYPKRLSPDVQLLKSYRDLAQAESGVSFLGRLGTYRYMDMHQVIAESIDIAKTVIEFDRQGKRIPCFFNQESS